MVVVVVVVPMNRLANIPLRYPEHPCRSPYHDDDDDDDVVVVVDFFYFLPYCVSAQGSQSVRRPCVSAQGSQSVSAPVSRHRGCEK